MAFFKLASKNILRHKIRSFLTVIGIATSVAVLFSIISFNRGFEKGLSLELERTGIHFLVVPSGCPHEVASLVLHGSVIPKYLDISIRDRLAEFPSVALVSPFLVFQLPNPEKKRIDLVSGMEMAHIKKLKPGWAIEGAVPAAEDEVLVGSEIAGHDRLKIGDQLTYQGNRTFRVSGILEKTGSQDDAFIYLPIATAQAVLGKEKGVTALGVRVANPETINAAVEEISAKIPGIQIITMSQVLNSLSSLAGSAKVLSLSIAAVAILISAVGIMNAILMAVFERTGEIGMMRAIGASRSDVFRIILVETTLITAVGGLTGIVSAAAGSGIIEALVRKFMPYVPSGKMIGFDPGLAGLCLLFSLALGVASGLYPAWKAARIHPIEAIKA